MTRVKDLHRRWMKEPRYKAAYEALEGEFQVARALIEARTRAGLSQTELAQRMNTSQSYVARIESGQVQPSTAALTRVADATGSRLKIIFEPASGIGGGRPRSSSKTVVTKVPVRIALARSGRAEGVKAKKRRGSNSQK